MKRRRRRGLELTERQQLGLVLVLVVLAAASLLYCVGFAGLTVRQVWEKVPAPWTSPESADEELTPPPEITATLPVTVTAAPAMTPLLQVTTMPAITPTLTLTTAP